MKLGRGGAGGLSSLFSILRTSIIVGRSIGSSWEHRSPISMLLSTCCSWDLPPDAESSNSLTLWASRTSQAWEKSVSVQKDTKQNPLRYWSSSGGQHPQIQTMLFFENLIVLVYGKIMLTFSGKWTVKVIQEQHDMKRWTIIKTSFEFATADCEQDAELLNK